MEQGVGTACAVQRRASRYGKAHMPVKSQGGRVLLVDVKCQGKAFFGGTLLRALQKRLAYAPAEKCRLHKQHLHLRAVAAHKSGRAGPCFIFQPVFRQPYFFHCGQVIPQHGGVKLIYGQRGKKAVRGRQRSVSAAWSSGCARRRCSAGAEKGDSHLFMC